MEWFPVKSGMILNQGRYRSCILQLQTFISPRKMWGFVATARHCLWTRPAVESVWSKFSKSDLKRSGGLLLVMKLFPPLFIRRIFSIYVNGLPYISGSLWGGEREKPSTQPTLTCFLSAPYTVPSDKHRVIQPSCKSKGCNSHAQKDSCPLCCGAQQPAAGGGPWHAAVLGCAGRGSRDVSDACPVASSQWGL